MIRWLTLALLAAGVCAGQQKPAISGTVTSLAGQPLKNAIVRLQVGFVRESGPTGPQPRSYVTSSDDRGNFLFENLELAGYILSAEHTGYLPATWSADSRSARSIVDVSSGQQLTGIAVKMTPQGVIAGRITNQDNEPFANVRVVLTHWVYLNGRRQLQPVMGSGSNPVSDFDGAFAIGNLAAGNYYLSAMDPGSPYLGGMLPGHAGPVESYVTTYYPGAADLSGATAIQLAAGAVVRGADIRMRQAVLHRVAGKVVDSASAEPPPNVNLFLRPKDDANLGAPSSRANYDYRSGAFEFPGVLPGVYILEASVATPRPAGQAGQRTQNPGPRETARQIVTVGDGDLEGIVVQPGPGAEITGQVTLEGSTAPPPAGISLPPMNQRTAVQLVSSDGLSGNRGVLAADDGTFTIADVEPGLYRVAVNNRPGDYLKSVRFGGQDVTKTALDLTSGSGGKLDILLSPNAAGLSGVVQDPSPAGDGAPAAGVTLTLWTPGMPQDGALDFTRTVASDAKGQFQFTSLPPGEYRVAAWEQIEQGLGVVPEFRIKFDNQATAVTLKENDHAQIDVTLIPRDAIETEAAKLR